MAIRDLLWACPSCGAEGSLEPAGRIELCHACRTRYRRHPGAAIEAEAPDGTRTVLSIVEWLERLPPAPSISESAHAIAYRRDRVEARLAEGEDTVRWRGKFLGRIERLGPRRPGTLTLEHERLVFADDQGSDRVWPLTSLTAVQASSSTLQIKARGEPVVSLRFADASIRLWELLLHAALRRLYRATGRGDIIEFQPRIVTQ